MDTSNKDKASKTIATIDVNIQWPKIDKKAWLDESLDDHFNCVLCGSTLHFKHKTDFVTQQVIENAECLSCGIKTRQSNHSLQ